MRSTSNNTKPAFLPPPRVHSSSSSTDGETQETPLIDQFGEALRGIDHKKRRGAIAALLQAESLGELVWVCMNANNTGKVKKASMPLPRRVAILGVVQRLNRLDCPSTQAPLLAFSTLGNLPSSKELVKSKIPLKTFVEVLPDRIPDALKPYAVQIIAAFDESYPVLVNDCNEERAGLYEAIRAKVKGYDNQIRMEQGGECRPADDVRPPASMASQAKRERADAHEQVIEAFVSRKKRRPALPDMPSTSSHFTPLAQSTPLRPQQPLFDPMERRFPIALCDDLSPNPPGEEVPLSTLRFPKIAAIRAEQFEKDGFKRAWLERLSTCQNVGAMKQLHLMSEDWQSALAAVLNDLGSSPQAVTTELALSILTGASGALSPELYKQIAAVLEKSSEWPASIPIRLETVAETGARHPDKACISELVNMINRCLKAVK